MKVIITTALTVGIVAMLSSASLVSTASAQKGYVDFLNNMILTHALDPQDMAQTNILLVYLKMLQQGKQPSEALLNEVKQYLGPAFNPNDTAQVQELEQFLQHCQKCKSCLFCRL